MHNEQIPTLDDLTAAWFTDLLRTSGSLGGDEAVAAVSFAPLGADESMMSSLQMATLDFDGPAPAAPRRLVVKLTSPSDQQRFIAGMFRFYEREIRFYNEFAPRVQVRIPRCLLAQIHPTEPLFVLILEDVGGRRQVDQIDGLGLADARLAVETLADLHAPFWGADFSPYVETFIPFDAPPMHAIMPDVFGNAWALVRGMAAEVLPAEVVALCDRFREVAPEVLSAMNGPDTLTHGDYRSDNLLFDDTGILVLDFQLAAVANGMVDVSYLIGQSVVDEVAATHADDLIDAYLARLATHGIGLDRADAMRAYEAAMVFFLQIPFNMLSNPDLPERSKTLARTMLRRAGAEIMRTGAHTRFA